VTDDLAALRRTAWRKSVPTGRAGSKDHADDE
jgi:hypothetical protein